MTQPTSVGVIVAVREHNGIISNIAYDCYSRNDNVIMAAL